MTRPATQAEIADHDRDLRKHELRPRDDQRYAVASLIGECEAIAASGALTEPAERSLRLLIAYALAAFNMPSKAERAIEPPLLSPSERLEAMRDHVRDHAKNEVV